MLDSVVAADLVADDLLIVVLELDKRSFQFWVVGLFEP